MRDETHEQIIEHRSVFAVDDALVVTTISKTDTPVCGTCWRYVQHDDEHQTTEYVRVPWPCEVARLREQHAGWGSAAFAIARPALENMALEAANAENARLRERVAALTAAISNYLHAYDWSLKAPPQDARPDELGHRRRSEMRAALAQADETGRGAR